MKEMVYKSNLEITLLDEGVYENYHYVIRSYGTHPCAYVEISERQYYKVKDNDDIQIECHGGITLVSEKLYSVDPSLEREGYWIGWDYAHWGDYSGFLPYDSDEKRWTTKEIQQEVFNVIRQLRDEEVSNESKSSSV